MLMSPTFNRPSRTQPEFCGDCGATDPSWASLNHGIPLCPDCCSVHRSLGRHISHVKYMRHGDSPTHTAHGFVQLLYSNVANSVWEHSLLDPIGQKNVRRKPTASDPVHPTKSDFIRAKHVALAFVLKPNMKQFENSNTPSTSSVPGLAQTALEVDLSKQLRAAVRSPNLETSLRLLVQGANPNFYHVEKGSMPLHVAAKSGQAAQAELLILFGADLSARDGAGCTASQIALQNGHQSVAESLIEAAYEVTDRLSAFIGAPRPDHVNGHHLTVPLSNGCGIGNSISEQLKIARGKLQLIPNKIFEELVMDLYDEIDRREMEDIWASTTTNSDVGAVPFLPTNPHLSATRNQGRQKLARFSTSEFIGFVTDVLLDAHRRQNMATLRPLASFMMKNTNHQNQLVQDISNLSDDEPLYDAVASDDDTPPKGTQCTTNIISSKLSHIGIEHQNPTKEPCIDVTTEELKHLRIKLLNSITEIDELKHVVQHLSVENYKLKSRIEPADNLPFDDELRKEQTYDGNSDKYNSNDTPFDNRCGAKRPVSMFEPRDSPYYYSQKKINAIPESRTTSSMYQMIGKIHSLQTNNEDKLGQNEQYNSFLVDKSMPDLNLVKLRTDMLTRRIQELWSVVQEQDCDAFVTCAEHIRIAIEKLNAIFPSVIVDDNIAEPMRQLTKNISIILSECNGLRHAMAGEDKALTEQYIQHVRSTAYNLASATKMLITQFS